MTGAACGIDVTFQRLSRELETCEAIGLRLEASIGDLVQMRDRTDAPPASALQELDELVQRLRDLAAFTRSIGANPDLDETSHSRALDVLKLARVRATLSGVATETGHDRSVVLF